MRNTFYDIESALNEKELVFTLKIVGEKLEYLPENLSTLDNLQILNLRANKLQNLDEQLLSLLKLEQLDLASNRFEIIPGVIEKMRQLKELDLSNNRITQCERNSFQDSIEHINLSNNQLTNFSIFSPLSKLSSLFLDYNPIGQIEFLSTNFPVIELLSIEHCALQKLTLEGDFKQLQQLFLAKNTLQEFQKT